METFKADKYSEEEEWLLQKLKSNCTDDGREVDFENSASIFHKLGKVYFQRCETCSTIECMICLIKCAVLWRAALVRTRRNAIAIKQEMKLLHEHLLISAKADQKDVDLCKKADEVKDSVDKMRKHANEELGKIPKVEASKSEDEMIEKEQNKVKAIELLQNKITADYTKIMASVADQCEQIMGEAPHKFAIIGMGSLARKEITPYSDFEHAIVLDSECDDKNEEILNYFRWYSVLFQIILVNLGETIIPRALNGTNSNLGSWFYDDATPSGVCFDGNFPWASKYPLGRQHLTKDKRWKTELIKSVPEMLKYLNSEENRKNGYHLGDLLTKVCYVYGNQSLFDEFISGVNAVLIQPTSNDELLSQISKDLKNFTIRSVLLKITEKGKLNVKKDFYRVTTLFIAAFGRLHNVTECSCFEIIRQLAETHVISNYAKHNLTYAIAIACEIRQRWYMKNKRQKDNINGRDATSSLFEAMGESSTIKYFQIAFALQGYISKRFGLSIEDFFSYLPMPNSCLAEVLKPVFNSCFGFHTFKSNLMVQSLRNFDDYLLMIQTNQATGNENETVDQSTQEEQLVSGTEFENCGK